MVAIIIIIIIIIYLVALKSEYPETPFTVKII